MSILQNSRFFRSFAALLVVPLMVSTGPIWADSPLQREFDRVQSANEAIQQVAVARLELESHYLDQLRLLRKNGHASFLELARQQVVVDGLRKQLDSLLNFTQFIAAIEEQNDRVAVGVSSENQRTPIKVYLPGSIRLAGWIEQDFSVRKQISTNNLTADPAKSDADNRLIALAEDKLARIEKRLQQYVTRSAIPEPWIHQAKLKSNLAKAELDLLLLKREIAPAQPVTNESIVEYQIAFKDQPVVTSGSDPVLQSLAYQVAYAEAVATGEETAAEVELRRQKLRNKALEQLYAGGFATESELKKSRESAENARLRLELESQRLALLTESCQKIQASLQNHRLDRVCKEIFEAKLDSKCAWPAEVFADTERVRHLIDLRRKYYELEGRSNATVHMLEMKKTLLEKLQIAYSQSANSQSNSSSVSNKLPVFLAEGQKNELAMMKLEIESLAARLQGFAERLSILALEEKRFVAQCFEQDRMDEFSFVSLGSEHKSSAATGKTAEAVASNRARINYLESAEVNEAWMIATRKQEYFDFTIDRRDRSPLIETNRYPVTVSSSMQRTKKKFGTSYFRKSIISPAEPSMPRWIEPQNRNQTYSYQSIYPFGILRADLRSRVPVGQIPWYLPGSPTNVR